MSVIDVEALIKAVSEDEPCGPDLEYDANFQELERAAQPKGEQGIGKSIVEAEEPDWSNVKQLAIKLFSSTNDLRVAVHLTKALLRLNGILGFESGALLIKRLLEEFWPSVHPQLDPDDDNDPTFRINTLANLYDPETTLSYLRRAPLVETKGVGKVNFRDIEIATGALSIAGNEESAPMDPELVSAIFTGCELEKLQQQADSLNVCLEHVADIEAIFTENLGAVNAPNFAELTKILTRMRNYLSQELGKRGVADMVEGAGDGVEGEGGAATAAQPAISGDIKNSDDVIRMLDKICDYYQKYEPSSPLPILLKRAKSLVRQDFMTILKNIAPGGMQQAEAVKGPDIK